MLSYVPVLHAQVQQGNVSVKLNRAELKGNALNLDMYMTIERMPVKRYESLILTITLKGAGRGQTLTLPPVIVNGANKRQMFERSVAIDGLESAKNGAYAVLKNDPDLIQYIAYKRAVTYKSWMNNCQLILTREFKDYNNNTTQHSTNTFVRRLAVRRVTGAQTNTNTINVPPANATNRQQQPATNRQPTNATRPATSRQPVNSSTTRRPAGANTTRSTTRQPANAATNRQSTTPARRPANSAAGSTNNADNK
jgi:hypothetical protein